MYKAVLEAIKGTLEVQLKNDIKSIFLMGSGFNGAEDITNFAKDAPCIGVGIKSIPNNTRINNNQLESICNFNLFLITTGNDKTESTKETDAYKLLEKLNLLIMNGKWGVESVYATEQNSLVCSLFNNSLKYKSNIWLWEINWKQKILLWQDKLEEKVKFPKSWSIKVDMNADNKFDEEVDFTLPEKEI